MRDRLHFLPSRRFRALRQCCNIQQVFKLLENVGRLKRKLLQGAQRLLSHLHELLANVCSRLEP
jgi:hypothetical protein